MIFTYIAVALITTIWLAKSVVEKKFTFKKTPFDWFIVFFLLSQLISTALSIHPRTSLFGYYTRFHGGLFSTFSYLILFYATATFITKKHITHFIGSVLIGALLASLYAFPEHFGYSPSCLLLTNQLDASCWIQDVQSRVFGTFGQPNWLAAYLVLLLPLAALVGIFSFSSKDKASTTKWNKIFPVLSLLLVFLFFSTLLFTQSRSGVLGMSVGWGVFVTLLLILQIKNKVFSISNISVLGGFIGILLLTALIFGTPFTPKLSALFSTATPTTEVVAPTRTVDRLEAGGTDSGDIRRIVWKGAVDVWKRYPIFGSGVETFAYSYYRDRPMEHNNVSEWDFLYNKAHNELLNFLATTGAFGLFAYLLLQAVVGWFLLKEVIWGEEKNTRLLSAAVLSGLVALHISNFFGFSTVMVTILMYTLPAVVINMIGDDKELVWTPFSFQAAHVQKEPILSKAGQLIEKISGKFISPTHTSQHISVGTWVLVSIISMAGIFVVIQISTIWFADHYYSKAKEAYISNEYDVALNQLKLAIQLSPKEALYFELYSKIASAYAITALEQNELELGTQFANSALEASNASLRLNPVHLNFYKTRNQVLVTLAQAKPELFNDALNTLDVAQKLSPTDAKLVYYQALVENAKDATEDAKSNLHRAIEMKPNYDSARFLLGQLLENEKNYDGAKEQYQYILENINPANEQVRQKLEAIATMSAKPERK